MSLSKTADPLHSTGSNPGRQENIPKFVKYFLCHLGVKFQCKQAKNIINFCGGL